MGPSLYPWGPCEKPRHDDKKRSHVLGQFPQGGLNPSLYTTTTISTSHPYSRSALGATHILKLEPRSWADFGPSSIVEITKPRVETGPKRWRGVAARLFPAGGEMLGQSRRKCARQVPDVTPVTLRP